MKERLTLEILISTMNRTDLSFLKAMFPNHEPSDFHILVINQTKHQKDLVSTYETIRVINSREFGLSKSRNLAIEHAIGDILIFADDDIQYLPDFKETILNAYQAYPEASLISFQFLNENHKLPKPYPKREGYIISSKLALSSVEISFRRKDIISHHLRMDENFGLGTTLPSSEEQLFKHEILRKGLKVAFVAEPIVQHKGKTSASNMGNPQLIKAISAQKYLIYQNWTYFWLLKYVFFLCRHGHVSFFGQIKAYYAGLEGISEIKNRQ